MWRNLRGLLLLLPPVLLLVLAMSVLLLLPMMWLLWVLPPRIKDNGRGHHGMVVVLGRSNGRVRKPKFVAADDTRGRRRARKNKALGVLAPRGCHCSRDERVGCVRLFYGKRGWIMRVCGANVGAAEGNTQEVVNGCERSRK